MKFSKKAEYGLRFLLALAELNKGRFMGIYQISLRHGIPMKFLEAIAVALRKSGLLEVKKGAGGGYRLRFEPDEISLLMVLECLDDSCKKELDVTGDMSSNQKAVSIVINDTKSEMRKVLSEKKLSDIQRQYKDLNESLMYYI